MAKQRHGRRKEIPGVERVILEKLPGASVKRVRPGLERIVDVGSGELPIIRRIASALYRKLLHGVRNRNKAGIVVESDVHVGAVNSVLIGAIADSVRCNRNAAGQNV